MYLIVSMLYVSLTSLVFMSHVTVSSMKKNFKFFPPHAFIMCVLLDYARTTVLLQVGCRNSEMFEATQFPQLTT